MCRCVCSTEEYEGICTGPKVCEMTPVDLGVDSYGDPIECCYEDDSYHGYGVNSW